MRIVFAGTPAPAIPTLERLVESTHEVVGVITRPPARVGRGRTLHPSPVAEFARGHDLPVIEASSFKDPKVRNHVESLRPDLGVVVAYGALIPQSVLECLLMGGSISTSRLFRGGAVLLPCNGH